jgi:hypothetical protein
VALTIGGKRVTVPGGGPPATPLSPLERLLVDGLIIVNREIVNAISAESFADAIRDLDPDMFDRLLNEALRWEDVREILDDALRGVVLDGSLAQAREIISKNPRIQRSPFADLQYTGRQLPSGIILPSDFAPPSPDVEFVISTPVEQMFNYVSEASVNYSRVRSGQLIQAIDESTRVSIRQLITQAFTEPRSVDDTARLIRRIVGLHPRWARAVERFHDKNVQGLIRDGMSSSEAQRRADEMTAKYRDKLIRRRAEMIARTETQQALNFGRQMSWVASDRAGLVDPRTMKEWRTAPLGSRYGPPCPTCTMLRGTRVAWNGTFDNGQQMPPAHPNCRCTAVLIPPSRGLTGLPSQVSTESWIAELDALEAEQIAALEKRRFVKHKGGGHDQKSHGAWAKGKSGDLTRFADEIDPSLEGILSQRADSSRDGWVYDSKWPDAYLAEAAGDAEYQRALHDNMRRLGFGDEVTVVRRGQPQASGFVNGSLDPKWQGRGYGQDETRNVYQVPLDSIVGVGHANEAEVFFRSDSAMSKHQRGKHDQSSHGAWAKGSGDRAARIADAARTGAPSGITLEDLVAIQENPSAFGFEANEFTEAEQRRQGLMPNDETTVEGMKRAVVEGYMIREKREWEQEEAAAKLSEISQDHLVDYFETVRDKGTIFVATDPKHAVSIVNKGEFDTVFETNRSNGAVAYDARRREEFASHDLHPNLDPNLRPVYGYVAFNNPVMAGAAGYGNVRFELKPETKERASMTDGDSLGSYATPIPMSGDPITREQAVGGSLGWSNLSHQGQRTPVGEETIIQRVDSEQGAGRYIEAQVKGGVKIDDVARIHVDGPHWDAPEAFGRSDDYYPFDVEALAEAAEARGIEIVYHG